MKKSEKICRDARVLTESARDTTIANVVTAVKSKTLKIDQSQLPILLQIIEMSINDGHTRASKAFLRSVESSLLSE